MDDSSFDASPMKHPDLFTQEMTSRPGTQDSCSDASEEDTGSLSPSRGGFLTQPGQETNEDGSAATGEASVAEDHNSPVIPSQAILLMAEEEHDDGDEHSTSSEEEPGAYERFRALRVARNQAYLQKLGLAGAKDPTQSEGSESEDESIDSVVPERSRGMLFQSPLGEKAKSSEQWELSQLQDRFPFRQTQIRLLTSLVGSTMAQAISEVPRSHDVYVPPPIFVTGPGATGKTCIVLDALGSVKQQYIGSLKDPCKLQPTIESAYVDCSTVDPPSMEAVVGSAFNQLTRSIEEEKDRQREKKKRKRENKKAQDAKKKRKGARDVSRGPKTPSTDRSHRKDRAVETENEENAAGKTKGDVQNVQSSVESPSSVQSPSTQESFEGELNEEAIDALEERVEQGRTQLSPANGPRTRKGPDVSTKRRRQSLSRKVKSAAQETATSSAPRLHRKETGSKRMDGSGVTSRAAVEFAKALLPLFGADAYELSARKRPGCAFLVLDNAERLLSLTAERSTESNNFLSQLLLLPKVYGLNLTVIVLTSSALLDGSRINNDVDIERALGTISIAVSPVRIQFPAYSGIDTFKTILQLPSVLPLIVGDSYVPSSENCGREQATKQATVSSFLDTLIQSVIGVTRDLREMIRLARQLWPTYIAPLDPEHISTTLQHVRNRLSQRSQNDEGRPSYVALQKEVRAYLDEKLLLHMKSSIDGHLFVLACDTKRRKEGAQARHLPYLSKCLLLAAFICQHNRPDQDKRIFTSHKSGKKKKKSLHRSHTTGSRDVEGAAYGGATTLEQQQLKMIRPRLFPIERMLSVFVNIVGLNQNDDLLRLSEGADMNDIVRSMGTTSFFQNLAQLREAGLLHESVGSALKQKGEVNLVATKYWCSLSRDEAAALAGSIHLTLSDYLL